MPPVSSCLHHCIHLKRLLSLLCTLMNHKNCVSDSSIQELYYLRKTMATWFPKRKKRMFEVTMFLYPWTKSVRPKVTENTASYRKQSKALFCIVWHIASSLASLYSVPCKHWHTHTQHTQCTINPVYEQCCMSVRGTPKVPTAISPSALEIIYSFYLFHPLFCCPCAT